jgi:membrane associated rhomboid family serine protease
MYGLPEELRCGACVGKRRPSISSMARAAPSENTPAWSFCLVAMALIVFCAELAPGAERITLLWNEPTRIWSGELWRLLTTILPHGGILHLLFNCYGLAFLGAATETAIGSTRFIGMLLLIALASSASEFLVHPVPVIGLSGVVYGIFGYLFAIRLYKDYARVVMTDSIMKQFVGWYVVCWVLTYVAHWGIANFAHTGGFLVGWLIGKATLRRHTGLRIAGVTVAVAALACLTMYMPWNDHYLHYREMESMIRETQVRIHGEEAFGE